jgi:hypothetical protein
VTLEQLIEELDDMATIYGPKVDVQISLECERYRCPHCGWPALHHIGQIGRAGTTVTIGVR